MLLDDLLSAIRGGESRSLVLRGEAGIGKTALLEYLVEAATDVTVVRAGGMESDMELAFASLHQLCGPMLDRLESLPAPQRDALRVVFGVSAGPAPDRFVVGLAALSLLSEAAEKRPLLCIVDDAQWLDQVSALTLAFVARRLGAEPVGMVFAARESGEELEHLPELEVLGLRDGDARALLSSAVGFTLDERVRDRILAETRGNPLALLELPRGLSATQLADGFGLLGGPMLSRGIEGSFARRLEALSDGARHLLLLAAAEPLGDPILLSRASEHLEIAVSALDDDTDGLLTISERVMFRHPLVRSAVYRSATSQERRAVHLALAEVTDREVDPDRRAWHLAAAAAGPDEEVAAELERSAVRAQARGGMAAAAAFLHRAVALTRDPARRSDRALAAAQVSVQAGAFDAALGLLATAEAGALDELSRARADLLRGQIAFASFGADAATLLLQAAKRLGPLDPMLARDGYLDAWAAALIAGSAGRAGTLLDISEAARSAPPPPKPPRPSDQLLDGLALLVTEGRAAAAPTLARATDTFARGEIPVEQGLRWGWLAPVAAYVLWDDEGWYTMLERLVQLARDAGALAWLTLFLNTLAALMTWCGDFSRAASLTTEADVIAEATGAHLTPFGALMLAAFRGREAEASRLITTTIEESTTNGQGHGIRYARWMAAMLFNGAGNYNDAFTSATQATDAAPELYVSAWALPELIESAYRSGHTKAAADAVDRLAEATQPSGTDWALGIEARCRVLLSDGPVANALYTEAIERLGRTRLRPELARAHLLYGEWLRRKKRRVDARAQLRAAHDLFTSIDMEGFAARARTELLATGEKVRKRTVTTRDDLTAQERQVAQLARDGLSNPEIGMRLFITSRTVQYHLRKVFSKLEIKSRHELGRALANDPATVR